jgi:hypothetical protein
LDEFVSVQKKQVFDVQGSGLNAWFKQWYREYYDVQQDFCSIVVATTSLRARRGWFRNILTNESIDERTMNGCLDVSSTAIIPYEDFICEFESTTTTPDVDDGSTATKMKYNTSKQQQQRQQLHLVVMTSINNNRRWMII